MQLLDFSEIPAEGERWGLFARDFLVELGFLIESGTDRCLAGSDDFCVIEQIQGVFNFHPFRWLVSPRHKAATRTAVKETEENDLIERLCHAKADGFLGFYSTQASATLLQTLADIKLSGIIKDFRIIDTKIMETHLNSIGCAKLWPRYFPNAALQRRPLHKIEDTYLPLSCDHCGKDLLDLLFREDHKSIVARIAQRPATEGEIMLVHDLYFACMGTCDESLQSFHLKGRQHSVSSVIPLADLVTPPFYLSRILGLIDRLNSPQFDYTDPALEKEKYLLRALAQRVLIPPSEGELNRAKKKMFGTGD